MTLLSALFIAAWSFLAGYQVGSKKLTVSFPPSVTKAVSDMDLLTLVFSTETIRLELVAGLMDDRIKQAAERSAEETNEKYREEIEWLGRIPCETEDGRDTCVYTRLQFGLRKDGVMVWEKYDPCDLPQCSDCKGDCVSILCAGCGK